MNRFLLYIPIGLGGAVVGIKIALEARLGARAIVVPTNDNFGSGEITASYPMLPPAADWAAPVGALIGCIAALAVTFVAIHLWQKVRRQRRSSDDTGVRTTLRSKSG